jgi:hypothetical protein
LYFPFVSFGTRDAFPEFDRTGERGASTWTASLRRNDHGGSSYELSDRTSETDGGDKLGRNYRSDDLALWMAATLKFVIAKGYVQTREVEIVAA